MKTASALIQCVTRTQRGWIRGPAAVSGNAVELPANSVVMTQGFTKSQAHARLTFVSDRHLSPRGGER